MRGAGGTFSHLLALFSTVAPNLGRASAHSREFLNEINDLEAEMPAMTLAFPFKIKHLAVPLKVLREGGSLRQRM
jgi:hypothetical protein